MTVQTVCNAIGTISEIGNTFSRADNNVGQAICFRKEFYEMNTMKVIFTGRQNSTAYMGMLEIYLLPFRAEKMKKTVNFSRITQHAISSIQSSSDFRTKKLMSRHGWQKVQI